MRIKITSGNLEVISSGTVRTAFENSIKFDFEEVWFEFRFSETQEASKIDFQVSDGGQGMMCKLDVNGNLYGMTQPTLLGTLDDRKFYFSFEVNKPSMKHDLWLLNYTFYLGEKVDV